MALAQAVTRVDEKIKEKAQRVFEREGLDMSVALRIFITQTANEGVVPISFNKKSGKSPSRVTAEKRLSAIVEKILEEEPAIPVNWNDPEELDGWEL